MRYLLLLFCFVTSAYAAEGEPAPGELSFCRFGPKMRVLQPVRGSKPCEASAKIQGLLWECVTTDQVAGRVADFTKRLSELASEECEKFCRGEGRRCRARFTPPSECGLQTDLEEAVAAGKKFGCRKNCGGQAFSYCSIYDAGYRLDDPAMVSGKAPNCVCTAVK